MLQFQLPLMAFLAVSGQGADAVLEKAGSWLKEHRERLRTFICKETVSVRYWRDEDGPKRLRRGRFEFRIGPQGEERTPLDERSENLLAPLFTVGGAFSALYGVLGPENSQAWTFRQISEQPPTLEVEIPAGRSETYLSLADGRSLGVPYKARIEFTGDGTRPVRMTRKATEPLDGVTHLEHTHVYERIEVDGEGFLLPVRQEVRMRQNGLWIEAVHEYSDYRQFKTETKVRFK